MAAETVRKGETHAHRVLEVALQRLTAEPDLVIDYVKICNGGTLEEVDVVDEDSVMLLAVKVGKTRLIDNMTLMP